MGDRIQTGKPPRPGKLSLLPYAGLEMHAKVQSWQVWLIPLVDKRVGGR